MALGQVLGVPPQGIAAAFQLSGMSRHAALARLVPDLASHLVQGVGGPGDDVKAVDAQRRVGAPLGHHLGDPGGGVGTDQGDLFASLLAQEIEEATERLLVAPDRRPDEPPGVVVDEDRQVAVALLVADLVDPDAAEAVEGVVGGPAVGTTRSMIDPTVRQATRMNSETVDLAVWVTSQATWSSKSLV